MDLSTSAPYPALTPVAGVATSTVAVATSPLAPKSKKRLKQDDEHNDNDSDDIFLPSKPKALTSAAARPVQLRDVRQQLQRLQAAHAWGPLKNVLKGLLQVQPPPSPTEVTASGVAGVVSALAQGVAEVRVYAEILLRQWQYHHHQQQIPLPSTISTPASKRRRQAATGQQEPTPDTTPTPSENTSTVTPVLLERYPGNRVRNTMVQRLFETLSQALERDGERGEQPPKESEFGAEQVREATAQLEQCLHEGYSSDATTLRLKLSHVQACLGDPANASLRQRFLRRDLPPQALLQLKAGDRTADEAKVARRSQAMAHAQAAAVRDPSSERLQVTSVLPCGKCGARKATYFQMQILSSDEPITTFLTCLSCGNAWQD